MELLSYNDMWSLGQFCRWHWNVVIVWLFSVEIPWIYSGCMCVTYFGWESGQPYWCEEHSCWDGGLLSSTGKLLLSRQKSQFDFSLQSIQVLWTKIQSVGFSSSEISFLGIVYYLNILKFAATVIVLVWSVINFLNCISNK